MKFKVEKNILVLFPEDDVDLIDIGTIWRILGGSVMFDTDSDNPQRKVKRFEISSNIVLKALTKIAP
jgi:hypothetical protein